MNQTPSGIGPAPDHRADRPGFWTAIATVAIGILSLTVAVTTPPRSGPFCRGVCLTSPYTDAAAFVPRDYLWMYPTIVMILLYVALFAQLGQIRLRPSTTTAPTTTLTTSLTAIAAGALVVDYAIQLTVMQPSLLFGETEGLSVFSQYNPHGVFIALENVGYALMALTFVMTGLTFPARSGLERAIRWTLLTAGTLTLTALVVLAIVYRADLDYRFEVAAILFTWLTLIITAALFSLQSARSATLVTSPGPPGVS